MDSVKQFDVTLEVSPADAFDLSATSFTQNSTFGVSPGVEFPAANQVKSGAAILGKTIVKGAAELGTFTLTGSSTLTAATTVTITVVKISLGPTSNSRDEFDSAALNLAVTVNPPVSEPKLVATSATDQSLDFSAVGKGQKADGSAGEATFSVMFTDATGAAKSGQTITWSVTNNGAQSVFLLGTTVTEIKAGTTKSVTSTTDANGAGSATFDAEGDKTAGSTSLSVTASTTASNSDNVSRSLSVAFSATWDVPVPAELASFAGQISSDKNVQLQWSVVSQSNNLGWQVYRSTDNVRFEKVGEMVLGAGTTDQLMSYIFTDNSYPAADMLYYYLKQVDLSGHTARSSVIEVMLTPARVLPTANELHQNYPNPFNPETAITFDLKADGVVQLDIYNAAGQHIRTLVNGQALSAGSYTFHWDGFDDSGAKVGSGVYLYHLQAGEYTSVKKMALLK